MPSTNRTTSVLVRTALVGVIVAAACALTVTGNPAQAAAPPDPLAEASATLRLQQRDATRAADKAYRRFQRIEQLHEERIGLIETLHAVAHNRIQPAATLAVVSASLERASETTEQRLAREARRATAAQTELADARRRLAAFRRAAEDQQERDEARAAGGPVPTDVPGNLDPQLVLYGFGGPHTAGVSASLIDRFLERQRSPLAGSGGAFVTSGLRWRIDPRLLVAIAGAESNFGQITCAPHNAWGWGCPTSPQSFASWEAGIDTVAEGLHTGYLADGLTSVEQIHRRYAPPGAANDPGGLNLAWPVNVNRYLLALGGDPADVRGISYAEASTGR